MSEPKTNTAYLYSSYREYDDELQWMGTCIAQTYPVVASNYSDRDGLNEYIP